jgi:hypothetical protein
MIFDFLRHGASRAVELAAAALVKNDTVQVENFNQLLDHLSGEGCRPIDEKDRAAETIQAFHILTVFEPRELAPSLWRTSGSQLGSCPRS